MKNLDHNSAKQKYIVVLTNGTQKEIVAHSCEFAGEMNSCLWFYNHIGEYETEIVHSFSAHAWLEVFPSI